MPCWPPGGQAKQTPGYSKPQEDTGCRAGAEVRELASLGLRGSAAGHRHPKVRDCNWVLCAWGVLKALLMLGILGRIF